MCTTRAVFSRRWRKSPQAFVRSLSQGLMSRDGPTAFAAFQERLERLALEWTAVWEQAQQTYSFTPLPDAVDALLKQALDASIVDADYPAFHKPSHTNFSVVKLLGSLAVFCAGRAGAVEFLGTLATANSSRYIFTVAHARALLTQRKFRLAAEAALSIKEHTGDYCVQRLIIDTQKALLRNGEKQDINIPVDNSDRFCAYPFTTLAYYPDTTATDTKPEKKILASCCPCWAWLRVTFNTDWNNDDIIEVRRSILVGDYKYCDELRCIYLRNASLPKKSAITDPYLRNIIDNKITCLDSPPSVLLLHYDTTCPMTCPSCPLKLYPNRTQLQSDIAAYMEKEVGRLLPGVRSISLSACGEALASEHSLRLIKNITPAKYPNLKICLITGLMPFTRKLWASLGESAASINRLYISIDGGTPETLEKLRKGLKWQRMHDALIFIRELKKKGNLENIQVNVVLQRDNYGELREILALASKYCMDIMYISPLGRGGFDANEFIELDVCSPRHPLFGDSRKALEELKKMHASMEEGRAAIEAGGKSVPRLVLGCVE